MPRFRVVAKGENRGAQANARGHLFERLIAQVLRTYGYDVDTMPSVNYAGMEIDVEGHEALTGIPMYAECKCYDTEVDSPKFQAFYGKYMSRWRRDHRCKGMFLAIPGLNSHAKGFYNENCETATDTTVTLLEEQAVVGAIVRSGLVVPEETLNFKIPNRIGTAGDRVLLYTDHGLMWLQYVVPVGSAIPDRCLLFDARGGPISDGQTIEYVQETCSDVSGFQIISLRDEPGLLQSVQVTSKKASDSASDTDQVVEVRGSSAWFEYQFPASPAYFVGRTEVLRDVSEFSEAIRNGSTSSRGLLFTGNSGWGKSSAVLACADLLRKQGHMAVVVDCRSISSPRSVLRVIDYAVQKFSEPDGDLFRGTLPTLTGFDGAAAALIDVSHRLKSEGRLAFLFLDQFENVFFLPEVLKRFRDLLFKMCDGQTNVVLGFAWKTDLVGATNEFPFQERDAIAGTSKRVPLETFSDVETNALLDKLKTELRTNIRKDLRFFLSEFSQGYPWLLKKLCAHVKAQREAGVAQSDIANRLLNIEQLFKEDLRGLSPDQEDTLRRIAKVAPVNISDLTEHYKANVVQSLVDSRLVVRIGNKFDIYWDIFRDYLNYGGVPVEDNYLLRVQVVPVVNAMRLLTRSGGRMDVSQFRSSSKLSEHSAMNVVRDLRLLGLANVDAGRLVCSIQTPAESDDSQLMRSIRTHIKDHLAHNRLVSRIFAELKSDSPVDLGVIGEKLSAWCPYVTATPPTWRMYARVLAAWLDFADLATYNRPSGKLSYYESATEFRNRDLNLRSLRRPGMSMPGVQYTPVERIAKEIAAAFAGRQPNWREFKKSTVQKAFATLEAFGFIGKTDGGFRVSPHYFEADMTPAEIREVFASALKKMPVFMQFVSLLERHAGTGCSHLEMGRELRNLLGVEWKDGTAKTNVKIMLDWARHTGFAPGIFAIHPRQGKAKAANLT